MDVKINLKMTVSIGLLVMLPLVFSCKKESGRTEQAKEKKAGPAKEKKAGHEEEKKAGPAGEKKTGPAGEKKTGPAVKPEGTAKQLWSAEGLKVPESVMYDPKDKILYVSNINGKPTEKNGKGFISKIGMNGKIIALEWAVGLDAPKGMGLFGNTLYVTDIDRLHLIDTRTGKIKKTVLATKAKFLNDIAIGPKGEVYVSDMMTGLIHMLSKGKLSVLVDVKSFKGANGMLMEGGSILVGTATGIVKVDPVVKKAAMHVPVPGFGMIDGLKSIGPDTYVISDWNGKIQIVNRAGMTTVVMDTSSRKIQAADLEYIAAEKMLLVPTFFDNRVVAYRLAGPAIVK